MKILIFTDAHVGHYKEFDQAGSRLGRCLDAVEYVLEFGAERGCEVVIDAGDLIDKKNMVDFTVYNALHRIIEGNIWAEKFHCLVGNHNMATYDGVETNLTPLDHSVSVEDIPRVVEYEDIAIAFMPFRRRLETWLEDWHTLCEQVQGLNKIKMCVAHQEVKGAETGTHRYIAQGGVEPAVLPGPFDHVVFGHYHKKQVVAAKSWYLGALLQQDFGEEGNPQIFYIFDTETNTWEAFLVPYASFWTVEDPDEINEGNFYRLLTSEGVDLSPAQRATVRVDIKPETVEPNSVLAGGIAGLGQMCEDWITEKVPLDKQATVRAVYNHLRQG